MSTGLDIDKEGLTQQEISLIDRAETAFRILRSNNGRLSEIILELEILKVLRNDISRSIHLKVIHGESSDNRSGMQTLHANLKKVDARIAYLTLDIRAKIRQILPDGEIPFSHI